MSLAYIYIAIFLYIYIYIYTYTSAFRSHAFCYKRVSLV